MSSVGVSPLCLLKSSVNAAIEEKMSEHFMLLSAEKLNGDVDFIFKKNLAMVCTDKGTKS